MFFVQEECACVLFVVVVVVVAGWGGGGGSWKTYNSILFFTLFLYMYIKFFAFTGFFCELY